MDLLKSVIVDSTPSLTGLLRFGFVETLRGVRSILLFYPLNVFLLVALVFALVYRTTSIYHRKQKFRAVYAPLPHRESPVEDIKLIKKEVREVQADLIAILKKSGGQEGVHELRGEEEEGVSEDLNKFLLEVGEKSSFL